MKLLKFVPSVSPWHPFASRPVSVHLAGAVVVCAALAMAGVGLVSWQRSQTQRVQTELAEFKRTMALASVPIEQGSVPSAQE